MFVVNPNLTLDDLKDRVVRLERDLVVDLNAVGQSTDPDFQRMTEQAIREDEEILAAFRARIQELEQEK